MGYVSKFAAALLATIIVGSTAVAQYKVGDLVVVIHDTDITVGKQVRQHVGRGLTLKVQDVKTSWLWVSHEHSGWIKTADVTMPPKAVEVFTEQIRQNPRDTNAYLARGLAWDGRGETDIAIRDFTEAIRLAPKNSAAFGNRGNCWYQKQEVDKAMDDFTEALRLDPTDSISYANRARIWIAKEEFDNAIADATEAIRNSPKFEGAYCVRAAAWSCKKQFDNAIKDCEECRRLNPKSGWGYNQLAWQLATNPEAKFRDGEKAVQFAKKACEITEWKQALCVGTLAAGFAEVGDFKSAVAMQTKAQDLYTEQEKKFWGHLLGEYQSGKPHRDKIQ